MSDALYQQAIKDFAKAAHGSGRLVTPDAEAFLDNPLCGDRVRIEVMRRDGRIAAVGHETKGCLLCRAAASILAQRAPGQTAGDIEAVRDALQHMLNTEDAAPPAWPELECFAPARRFPSRHGCVLLPFNALLTALEPRPL